MMKTCIDDACFYFDDVEEYPSFDSNLWPHEIDRYPTYDVFHWNVMHIFVYRTVKR